MEEAGTERKDDHGSSAVRAQAWTTLASKQVGEYRVFDVRQERRRSPRTGDEHDFYVLEMPEWINVIAVTPTGRVVVIYQFRHGTGKVSLEIPGGIVDEADGDLATAARRELREETGYDADEFMHIGQVTANPAIQSNRCHTFLALGARRVGELEQEEAEDIHVEEMDLTQIPQLIGTGRMDHALVIAAFYWLELLQREQPEVLRPYLG